MRLALFIFILYTYYYTNNINQTIWSMSVRMFKCDRCGAIVNMDRKTSFSRPYKGIYRIGKKIHICPDCAASFKSWFESALKEDK